jgi:hypothetical protein
MARGWSLGLYIAGIAALGVGVLVGAIVGAATGSMAGLTVALSIAGLGIATGALGLWESRRFSRRASRLERTVSEHRVLALAEDHGGALQVTDVARALRVRSADAEAILDALVDEVRVSMQVTDDGGIRYVFREITEVGPPRVRVASAPAEPVEESTPQTVSGKDEITN